MQSLSFRQGLVAALCALATGFTQARPLQADLQTDLQAMLAEQQLAGAVVALVDGDHTQTLALGRFSTATGQPLQASDRVLVGSVAKTVVALAVLRLVSQDRLALDAPLDSVLPQVKLHNPWAARSPVRVRHLLDMTSGLPDLQLWHLFNPGHSAQQPLALALRSELGPVHLRTEPGRQFNYSNLGFTLAAMVVEAVTGEAYETWIERELLLPLGMTDSRLQFRSQADDPRLAWGHLDEGQPWAERPVAVRPATQFATTAPDMLSLMRFLLGDGRLHAPSALPGEAPPLDAAPAGPPFIRAELMAALGQPPGTDAVSAGLPSGYGLGFYTRDRHGAVGLCHGGSVAGWRAMLCVFRARQRGFFIAFNSDREDADYGRFDARLVQHLAVATQAVAEVPGDAAAHAVWSGWYVPAPGRLEALALTDRLFGLWRLQLQPGQATLQEGLAPARPLHPAGALYRQADRVQPTLALLRGDDGQPRRAGAHIQLRRVNPWAQGALWAVAATGLLSAFLLLPLAAWRWRRLGAAQAARRLPAAAGLVLLLLALAAWVGRGWPSLGAPGVVAWAVMLGSLVLAAGSLLQAWHALRQRPPGAWLDLAVALALLGLCALLAAYGLWPLRPDRL
jgi:CubicO group peptidase (beta-lactamase class C family)